MSAKILISLLLVSSAIGLAAAQAEEAPPLSPQANILYAHHDTSDTAELVGWANTLAKDGDDTAMGPSAACTQHSGQKAVDEVILTAAGTDMDRTYTFNLTPAQRGFLTLDDAKVISTIHVGAGSCFGEVDITSTLMDGDVKVAEGTATGHWFDNTAAIYPSVTIEADVLVNVVDSSALVWKITLKGTTGGAAFLGVSKDKGETNITLPILLGGGAGNDTVTYETIEGDATKGFEFENTSTKKIVYNWTAPAGHEATIEASGEFETGSLGIRVHDATGQELANETWQGPIEDSISFTTGTMQSVALDFTSAKGTVELGFTVQKPASSAGNGSQTPTTNTTGSNQTGSALAQDEDASGVPVPAALAIVAPLAALWLLRRRV